MADERLLPRDSRAFFKEAWYHDFAPPIHSLDRHGDFAPPLVPFSLETNFLGDGGTGTDTGGDGLQYHFGTYGADNEGDWFYAAANDTSAGGGAPSIGYTDQAGNIYGFGFSWQFDTGDSGAPFAVTNDGGFLVDTAGDVQINGESSLDLWSAGAIDWFSNGGTINTDPGGFGINASGVTVTSNGPVSLESTTGDDVSLITSGTGKVNIEPHGDCNIDPTGNCEVHLAPGKASATYNHLASPLLSIQEDSTTVHNLGDTKTLTINDHNGSPLVTYTG